MINMRRGISLAYVKHPSQITTLPIRTHYRKLIELRLRSSRDRFLDQLRQVDEFYTLDEIGTRAECEIHVDVFRLQLIEES
jgi:hypothetical protein